MEEDNFSNARLNSMVNSKYRIKTTRNNTKRAFIDEYYKSNGEFTDEIRKRIREYKLAKRGILFENYPDLQVEVIPEDVLDTFLEIKKSSKEDFIKFFKSYLNKIDLGYNQEMRDNAFRDLKVAYHVYRKCNTPDWNCPYEMITETEMENLYKILNPDKIKEPKNVIELDIKQR